MVLNDASTVCRGLGVGPATYHRWQKEYGGADVETVREYRSLKEENARLKRLVADLLLENQALKELAEEKWQARPGPKWTAMVQLQRALELSERRACKVVGQLRSTQR